MDYPDPPSSPSFQSSADKLDGLLSELHEVQVALVIVECHVRLRRANSATGDIPFRGYRSYALYDAGRVIDRVAETLRIEAACMMTAQRRDHSAQLYAEVSLTDAVRCEPVGSEAHEAHREWIEMGEHVDSGGAK
jgi:hypothetical protein